MIQKLSALSALLTVLFIQQIALYNLIGIQFTFLLLILYSKTLSFKSNLLIIAGHIILNAFIFGGATYLLAPFMFLGYLFLLISTKYLIKTENEYLLALWSAFCGLIYLWILIIPSIYFFGINFWVYFLADIPWEIMLAVVNFLTILVLFKPLYKFLNTYIEFMNINI